jgi:hypothetical protein
MASTAVRDVTRALQKLLLSQLTPVGGSQVQVSLLPPGEALPSGLGANLYLYRITESPFTRNQPWVGDRTPTAGNPMPALGLELSYLLTPFAPAPDATSATGDDAHTMLGAAMLALYENPILNNIHIAGFDADAELTPTLLNSYEQVKIRLMTTSLDELSKIWATINQPYRLSVAYDVSLVELTPDTAPPLNASTVVATSLAVGLLAPPRIDSLAPSTGAIAHVDGTGALVANTLVLTGSSFSLPGQTPVVLVGGQPATLNTVPAPSATSLTVSLPVTPGAGPSQDVVAMLGSFASAPQTFIVLPWLDRLTPQRSALDSSGGAPVLALSGSGFSTTPAAVRLDGPGGTTNVTTFTPAATDTAATIALPVSLANGVYQVRIVRASPASLASNPRTLEIVPLLATPIGLAIVTVAGVQVHQLTLNGARLNGTLLAVLIDGIAYGVAANANAAQLVLTLSRLLDAGAHTVAVTVDGSQSSTVALVI